MFVIEEIPTLKLLLQAELLLATLVSSTIGSQINKFLNFSIFCITLLYNGHFL